MSDHHDGPDSEFELGVIAVTVALSFLWAFISILDYMAGSK